MRWTSLWRLVPRVGLAVCLLLLWFAPVGSTFGMVGLSGISVCMAWLSLSSGDTGSNLARLRSELRSPLMIWLGISVLLFFGLMVAASHWRWPAWAVVGAVPGSLAAGALLLWFPTLSTSVRQSKERDRSRRGLCPGCGYDLRGNTSGVCPECGRGILKRLL